MTATLLQNAPDCKSLVDLAVPLIGVLGVLVGAAIPISYEFWRDHKKAKSSAAYLALRVATSLVEFANSCLDALNINRELVEDSKNKELKSFQHIPPAPQYPSDDDGWRALDSELREMSLTFQVLVGSSRQEVDFMAFVGGLDQACDLCRKGCADLGQKALSIAAVLRVKYKYPPFETRVSEYLQQHKVGLEQ